jgi:tetrahydromethanopterin S-methyltransferase subunit C
MATLRTAFWVTALFVLAMYGFFVALGAWNPAEVVPLTIAMGVLALLWVLHALLQRGLPPERNPRMISARERRGF